MGGWVGWWVGLGSLAMGNDRVCPRADRNACGQESLRLMKQERKAGTEEAGTMRSYVVRGCEAEQRDGDRPLVMLLSWEEEGRQGRLE